MVKVFSLQKNLMFPSNGQYIMLGIVYHICNLWKVSFIVQTMEVSLRKKKKTFLPSVSADVQQQQVRSHLGDFAFSERWVMPWFYSYHFAYSCIISLWPGPSSTGKILLFLKDCIGYVVKVSATRTSWSVENFPITKLLWRSFLLNRILQYGTCMSFKPSEFILLCQDVEWCIKL